MKKRMTLARSSALRLDLDSETSPQSRVLPTRRSSASLERQAFGLGNEPRACVGLPTEIDRVRLIGELSRILHEPEVPESMRAAGLTLIGWLARRMPGEDAHRLGVMGERAKAGVSRRSR